MEAAVADELLADADPEMRRYKLLKRKKSALTLHIVLLQVSSYLAGKRRKERSCYARQKNKRQSEDDLITAIYSILDFASEKKRKKIFDKKDLGWPHHDQATI